jgi:hypothetical protein
MKYGMLVISALIVIAHPGALRADDDGGSLAGTNGANYAPATTGSSVLKGNGSGGFANAGAADVESAIGSQSGNVVLASPNGSSGNLTPRALGAADLPNFPVSAGGTGATSASGARTNLGTCTPIVSSTLTSTAPNNGTNYTALSGYSGTFSTAEAYFISKAPRAGVLKDLYVTSSSGSVLSAGTSWTITVRDNAANTALTCTINSSSTSSGCDMIGFMCCNDLSDIVSVAAGDDLDYQITPSGAPTSVGFRFGVCFE